MHLHDDYINICEDIFRRYPDVIEIVPCPMMHIGWELDNAAAVAIFQDGSRRLFALSHNSLYEAKESNLVKKAEEYRQAATETENVLAIFRGEAPVTDGWAEKAKAIIAEKAALREKRLSGRAHVKINVSPN